MSKVAPSMVSFKAVVKAEAEKAEAAHKANLERQAEEVLERAARDLEESIVHQQEHLHALLGWPTGLFNLTSKIVDGVEMPVTAIDGVFFDARQSRSGLVIIAPCPSCGVLTRSETLWDVTDLHRAITQFAPDPGVHVCPVVPGAAIVQGVDWEDRTKEKKLLGDLRGLRSLITEILSEAARS